MNPSSTSFVLGYHGCDRQVAEKVFAGSQSLKSSDNDYDWLGDGIYFWEYNAQRAYDFACQIRKHPSRHRQKIRTPAVVGAIIDLGYCLNLLDSRFIEMVSLAKSALIEFHERSKIPIPKNSVGTDLLLRKLDCAVIRFLHETRKVEGDEPFDTARAAFFEGGPLYKNSGFSTKTHIQLAVRNPACIKGYFRPIDDNGKVLTFR